MSLNVIPISVTHALRIFFTLEDLPNPSNSEKVIKNCLGLELDEFILNYYVNIPLQDRSIIKLVIAQCNGVLNPCLANLPQYPEFHVFATWWAVGRKFEIFLPELLEA